METLEIKKENALKAFESADKNGKALLTNLFGKEILSRKITDRVKTFEDACEVLGIKPNLIYSNDSSDLDIKSIRAYQKLSIIARALNEGWTPDWENTNQYKYFPWFKHVSGVGLSCNGYDGSGARTAVGSRLCFKSSDLATYAGTQFEEIYREFLTL